MSAPVIILLRRSKPCQRIDGLSQIPLPAIPESRPQGFTPLVNHLLLISFLAGIPSSNQTYPRRFPIGTISQLRSFHPYLLGLPLPLFSLSHPCLPLPSS